jgi:hypothetical protein
MSSTRNGNVKRHIRRRHGGSSQPYNYDMIQYDRRQHRRHHIPPISYTPNPVSGQESYKNFDLFIDRMIKLLSKLVDFNNLCDQLYNFNQRSIASTPRYRKPSQNFSSVMAQGNNNDHLLSNPYANDIFGFRGHVCKQCLGIYIDYRYFLDEDLEGEWGRNKGNHVCDPNEIAQAQLDIYKDIYFNDNF